MLCYKGVGLVLQAKRCSIYCIVLFFVHGITTFTKILKKMFKILVKVVIPHLYRYGVSLTSIYMFNSLDKSCYRSLNIGEECQSKY